MPAPLVVFCYLQLLDLLSTLAFLAGGVTEGNPLVRWAMEALQSPIGGLVLAKGLALGLGLLCWFRQRNALLNRINAVYAAVVIWNLVAIVFAVANGPVRTT